MPSTLPTELRTERLVLRPWRAADAVLVAPLLAANVAHLSPWIPPHVVAPLAGRALEERLEGFAADFAADRAYRFALLSPDGASVYGEADLFPRSAAGRVGLAEGDRVELGYWLDAAATGRGLATEATQALFDLAATLPRMTHAEIRCDEANAASAAVPRRLGFTLGGAEGRTQVWRRALHADVDTPA